MGGEGENFGSPVWDDGVFTCYITFARRGQKIRGLWLRDWEEAEPQPGTAGKALGVGDDGVIRYLGLRAAGSTPSLNTHPSTVRRVLHETQLRRHLLVIPRAVAALGTRAS